MVAQHGLQYAITHQLGLAAVSGRETVTGVPAHRIWWLLRGVAGASGSPGLHAFSGRKWMVIRDDACLQWLQKMPVAERSLVIGNNPFHLGRYLRYHCCSDDGT